MKCRIRQLNCSYLLTLLCLLHMFRFFANIQSKKIKKKYFKNLSNHFFLFKSYKIWHSSSVFQCILRNYLERYWLKLKNWIQEVDSRQLLFRIKIARAYRHLWRHFRPTYGGNEICICTQDVKVMFWKVGTANVSCSLLGKVFYSFVGWHEWRHDCQNCD